MSPLIASAGPFIGVRTLSYAPYTDGRKYLQNALNGYVQDPQIGWVPRPQFTNPNASAQMGTGQRMQGTHAHVDPASGTIYRFFAVNGKLYRSNDTFTSFTDVSPVGIAIDNGATTRVSFASVGASLVVSDGVNRPWVASNFAATPITGTYIDIDGAGGSWSAWGKPTVYQDSVFWIAQTVPGGSAVLPRVGLVWSEPNQPTVGYTQTGYADYWNLFETGSDPLYAIWGTNNGLFYWRANSIGLLAGTPSISFSTTATRDARGTAVGTVSPWAVAQYQDKIFFLDMRGRTWMMPLDGEPQPIWQQASGFTDGQSPLTNITWVSVLSVGAVVPELNQYVVALAGDIRLGVVEPPYFMMCFDAESGTYGGAWEVMGGSMGVGIDVLDVQRDSSGAAVLCVGGGKTSQASGGYVWTLNQISNTVGSESTSAVFCSQTTWNLSFSADTNLQPDTATLLTNAYAAFSAIYRDNYNTSDTFAVTPVAPYVATPAQYRSEIGLGGTATRAMAFQFYWTLAVGPGCVQRVDVFGATSRATAGDT